MSNLKSEQQTFNAKIALMTNRLIWSSEQQWTCHVQILHPLIRLPPLSHLKQYSKLNNSFGRMNNWHRRPLPYLTNSGHFLDRRNGKEGDRVGLTWWWLQQNREAGVYKRIPSNNNIARIIKVTVLYKLWSKL